MFKKKKKKGGTKKIIFNAKHKLKKRNTFKKINKHTLKNI